MICKSCKDEFAKLPETMLCRSCACQRCGEGEVIGKDGDDDGICEECLDADEVRRTDAHYAQGCAGRS